MSRIAWVLTVLVVILIGVAWWLLAWSPTSEEIEATRQETASVQQQVDQRRAEARRLREVREQAPEIEYELLRADVVMPPEAGIASVLRQLELAAQASGVRLNSVAPSAPSPTEINGVELQTISLSLALEGRYYQVVDLLRRMEDPEQFVRGLTWTAISISPAEYPTLNVSLSGQLYTRAAPEVTAPPPADAGEPGAGDGEPDVDGTEPDGGDLGEQDDGQLEGDPEDLG